MLSFHSIITARRWWRAVGALCTVVTLAACAADRAVAPATATVSAKASPAKSALDAFVAAQGTYCEEEAGLSCDAITQQDIGYILLWCGDTFCANNQAMTADFGGVNARWWARRGLPSPGAFSYTGSVNETLTPDGRRRLVVNVRATNTFVSLVDLADFKPMFGADFEEYPGNATPGVMPVVGDATISADFTLPSGYVGMPDLAQIFYDPDVFFDINRLVFTSRAVGNLRREVNGVPAGTKVQVDGEFHFKTGRKYSGDRQKFFSNLRSVGLGGASRITVRPVP